MAQAVYKRSDFFADDAERDEITLANGAKVWVRQSLSAEGRARYQRSLMSLQLDTATGQVKVEDMAWDQNAIKTCQAYIIDWDFGPEFPYSADQVPLLKDDLLDEISQGIDRLQTARRETVEKKGLRSVKP